MGHVRPRVVCALVLAAALAASTASARAATSVPASTGAAAHLWSPLGEPGSGGRIGSLSVSPADPSRVLVGGDMLGVGLSTDGGTHWSTTAGFASWEINDFTWHPTDPDVVWVGTMSGPYRSGDGGATWTSARLGLPTGDHPYSAPVQKVLIDPRDPAHLLAFGGNQREFKAAVTGALNYGAVYESRDAGEHWATVGSVGADTNILDVVPAPHGLDTLYVATRRLGVLRSTDGGRGWRAVNDGLPRPAVMGLAIDPAAPRTLWAAVDRSPAAVGGVHAPGGVYRTTDGAATWSPATTGLPQTSSPVAAQTTRIASVHRSGDGTLYTADQGHASQTRFVSRDGGASWSAIGSRVAGPYPAASTPYVWATSADGSAVYGGTSDAIIRSRDDGASWETVSARPATAGLWRGTGFSGLLGTRATFSSTRRGLMLLTAFDAGSVLRSADGGASWNRPLAAWDDYNGAYDVASGGALGSVAYAVLGQAGAFNGLATSADGGASWTVKVGGGLPARHAKGADRGSVAVASSDGGRAYAVLPDGRLYSTSDTGRTWERTGVGGDARAVAVSADLRRVYVGTDRGVLARGPGQDFALLPSSPAGLRRLVVSSSGELYGTGPVGGPASVAGLWRYAEGAWQRVSANRFVSDVATDPADPDRVVFVTNDNPYHDRSSATGVWVITARRSPSTTRVSR